MKFQHITLVGVAIGALLIVASVVWTQTVTAETVWSETEAEELNNAVVQLHSVVHEACAHDERANFRTSGEGHSCEHANDGDLASRREDVSRQEAELRAAKFQRDGVPKLLRLSGVAIVAVGGILYLATKRPPFA